jgi:hypothetical protein
LGLVGAHSGEKYTAKAVQLSTPPALFRSSDPSFRLRYCLKSFGHTIRKVQRLSLSIHAMPSAVLPEALRAQPRKISPAGSQNAKFWRVDNSIKSDARRATLAGLRSR